MAEQEIHFLTRDSPADWTLVPQVLVRAAMFCRKYDADTTPESLCQSIMEHFVCEPGRQSVRAMVAVQDGVLVGHLLLSLDHWCGTMFCTVVQYESDQPLEHAKVLAAFDDIAAWARGKGATILRLLAIGDDGRAAARVRLFQRVFGFQPRRIMLDKLLGV